MTNKNEAYILNILSYTGEKSVGRKHFLYSLLWEPGIWSLFIGGLVRIREGTPWEPLLGAKKVVNRTYTAKIRLVKEFNNIEDLENTRPHLFCV